MNTFVEKDKVLVNAEGSYIDGLISKLYTVDDEYGYIDYDGKAWCVPFAELQLLCAKHPKYQAKREPTSNCETCLRIWNNNK